MSGETLSGWEPRDATEVDAVGRPDALADQPGDLVRAVCGSTWGPGIRCTRPKHLTGDHAMGKGGRVLHRWSTFTNQPGEPPPERHEEPAEYETVDHPEHYNQIPGIECIDVVEHMSFPIGTVIKHLWRAGLKPSAPQLEDLRKARWYLNHEIERLEKAETVKNPK